MRPVHEDDVAVYDRELVSRLEALLGPSLVGVYAGGSRALGETSPAAPIPTASSSRVTGS
jgi:hypothetical protein